MRRFLLCLSLLLSVLLLCSCTLSPAPPPEEVRVSAVSPTPEPSPTPTPEPTPEPVQTVEPAGYELVRIKEFLPELPIDLRYATAENFTGSIVYDFSDAWLRYGTIKKLSAAQELLAEQGYSLVIWDAFRPHQAQFTLWMAKPDETYVANPYSGHSSHSSGGTVDVTLIGLDGTAVEMPSGFDEFSALADRSYGDVSPEAAEHAAILEAAMVEAGFLPYAAEWWHFRDLAGYGHRDLDHLTLPRELDSLYTPECEAYITLRAAPSYDAKSLAHIPLGADFPVLGFAGLFARVEYGSQQGYVALEYIKAYNG